MSSLTCWSYSYSDSDRLQSADRGRKSNTDIYRAKGYRGSVSITDQYVVWIGFDTSHGYMFNEHHYLGAGVGLFLAPTGFFPLFGHTFIEYNAYILKRASTPTAGIKVGFHGICKNRRNWNPTSAGAGRSTRTWASGCPSVRRYSYCHNGKTYSQCLSSQSLSTSDAYSYSNEGQYRIHRSGQVGENADDGVYQRLPGLRTGTGILP